MRGARRKDLGDKIVIYSCLESPALEGLTVFSLHHEWKLSFMMDMDAEKVSQSNAYEANRK